MERESSSKASLTIAFGWLRDCLKNHDSCKPPTELQKPPKRLINVGNETQNPFLVETSSSQQLEWLSLSYCWGNDPLLKLTTNNMNDLRGEIPQDKLDPTIWDAILVTRALEITYIWIDALCIIQDPEGKDWNEQASKMNEIYGGSTVTLVVASSDSVKNGFLKEREVNYISISRVNSPAADSTDNELPAKVFLSPEWDKNEDELNGPWSTRGWTMQEGLLSSRLLHYTSSQMIWKCSEEQRFERGVTESLHDEIANILTYSDDISFGSGWLWKLDTFMKFKRFPHYLPSSKDYILLSDPETFRLWYDVVEEYTHRRFSHIKDRLLAISGLAKIFGKTIGSREYVAGLWKPDLIRGLLWHTKDAKLIPRQYAEDTRPPDNPFPSWSWASVGYEHVENRHKNQNDFQPLSQVEKVEVHLMDPCDPFSDVKSGSIRITGRLKKLPRLYNKEWKSAEASMSKLERYLSEIIEEESPRGVENRYYAPSGGGFAVLQMLGSMHSRDLLVLEASNGTNEYRRIGVLPLHYSPKSMMASPNLIAAIDAIENSRKARLGPQNENWRKRTHKISNDVWIELREEDWEKQTITIV
jgi:Heterokaryon incompatibility protein (HET)